MSRYYTGIGSRETPEHIMKLMQKVAYTLADHGYILRSGGAGGADSAFEKGALEFSQTKQVAEIYIPWKGFNDVWRDDINNILPVEDATYFKAKEIAEWVHPAWERLKRGGKALHTRNVYQILGKDLDTPSSFVICYAKPKDNEGFVHGGTGTAVTIALQRNIPVYNLWHEDTQQRLKRFVGE